MRVKIKGIVIREAPKGETSKLLTVLTADMGVITVNAKGVRKISSPYIKSAQLFAFSDMLLYVKNGFYTLTEASLIADFYSLSADIKKYALACYLCDAASAFAVAGEECANVLRLLLNSLYALENGKNSDSLVKSAFELRLCAECGFYPDVSICAGCDEELTDKDLIFNIADGCTLCTSCGMEGGDNVRLTPSVAKAIIHITESDLSRFLLFRIGNNEQQTLSHIAERFMLARAERGFKTLAFYKKCEELP